MEESKLVTSNRVLHQMTMLWGPRISEMRLATPAEFNTDDMIWTTPEEHSKMGNVIRRPIFKQMEPFVERLLNSGMTFCSLVSFSIGLLTQAPLICTSEI